MASEGVLKDLIEQLSRLPGIGAKSAERLAYHLLNVPEPEALALADAIRSVKGRLRSCSRCHHISESEICSICADESRDRRVLCVVEQPRDLHAIEQSGSYRGLYHVLGGTFSPMEDRGPDSLTTSHLVERVREEGIEEVIIATNPDFQGDGTALLVAESLEPMGVSLSRIARGIPSGSHIEYMNRSILRDALEGRRRYSDGSRADPQPAEGREAAGGEAADGGGPT